MRDREKVGNRGREGRLNERGSERERERGRIASMIEVHA